MQASLQGSAGVLPAQTGLQAPQSLAQVAHVSLGHPAHVASPHSTGALQATCTLTVP